MTFALTSQPTNGTITQFNASKGTLVYTPKANTQGTDSFQYTVTDNVTGSTPLTSAPATVSITGSTCNDVELDARRRRQPGPAAGATPVNAKQERVHVQVRRPITEPLQPVNAQERIWIAGVITEMLCLCVSNGY